jgi:predicted DNA-binding protein
VSDLMPLLVRMPPEMHAALKARAAKDERGMAQTVRWLVGRYLAEVCDEGVLA